MEFLGKLFSTIFGVDKPEATDDSIETNDDTSTSYTNFDQKKCYNNTDENHSDLFLKGFSYLFNMKKLTFDDQFSFVLRYIVKNEEIWMVGYDFARGVGFANPHWAVDRYVQFTEIKTLNQLLYSNNRCPRPAGEEPSSTPLVKCINKTGALQLLNRIEFENKAEFIACLLETFNELEQEFKPSSSTTTNDGAEKETKCDDKLSLVLSAIESININNSSMIECNNAFKNQVIEKFGVFEKRFDEQIKELQTRISQYDNVERLYVQLREHHAAKRRQSTLSMSFFNIADGTACTDNDRNDKISSSRFETVKFPRDHMKHPRLAVYVKTNEHGTKLAFCSGQQKHMQLRKRKFQDMELVYDKVHPNPLMALHCIDEELGNKNYKYSKRGKREYHIESDIDTVKSFIYENVN
ncbi:38.7k [Sucra jujuba nucleopolyhedrovirus]|uniref:38.7k n=1 Tax=Sucra jujuba nucleopolyhedrovirus TaxID=1563660 RepID=A0A097P955_9ABAC|nr:38.7k [Sucra jujuba nucleopolyhedrovirus]AIU41361.1 38.7k [Sucra jujuba nucleopolyhedrovirus]